MKKEPDKDATDVDVSVPIEIVSNKAMLENTINRTTVKLLNEAKGTEVGDTVVSLDPSDHDKKTILITHTLFEKSKKYNVIVTTGVNVLAGTPMPEEK